MVIGWAKAYVDKILEEEEEEGSDPQEDRRKDNSSKKLDNYSKLPPSIKKIGQINYSDILVDLRDDSEEDVDDGYFTTRLKFEKMLSEYIDKDRDNDD